MCACNGRRYCVWHCGAFYIFDEPTSSLDTLNAKHIMDLIKELSGSKGILHITHRREMLSVADEVISLYV